MNDRREPIGATPDTIRIGQPVRLRDFKNQRVTGKVCTLTVEAHALMVTVGLDKPIVIPARGEGDQEINIYTQHVPVHEVMPFDDRDEVIAELRAALQAMLDYHDDVAKPADQRLLDAGYAAINKSTRVA